MPKRGATLPWRVEYTYPPTAYRGPDGVKGTEVRHTLDEAETLAEQLSARGASGRIFDRVKQETVAHFTAKPVRVACRDCGLGGHRDAEGVYHGDRDVEPCPRSTDDFHHWIPDETED